MPLLGPLLLLGRRVRVLRPLAVGPLALRSLALGFLAFGALTGGPLAFAPLAPPPAALAQRPPAWAPRRSAWPVALPPTATVRLKQGGSLSGRLVRFTPTAITLAAASQSQAVALGQVGRIDFVEPRDLWVSLPDGRRQIARPLRGMTVPLTGMSSAAVRVIGARDTAIVDLSGVLSEAQFARLSANPKVVPVLTRMEVVKGDRLALWVRSYGVE
jgi:hypothetical protein